MLYGDGKVEEDLTPTLEGVERRFLIDPRLKNEFEKRARVKDNNENNEEDNKNKIAG